MCDSKNTPKAIFFDLDGTLLYNGKLTESGKQAVFYTKEKGALVFVATGRNKWEVECMKEITDLPFDGYVTMNGAYSYIGNKVLCKQALSNDVVAIMAKHISGSSHYCLFCEADFTFASYMDEKRLQNCILTMYRCRPPVTQWHLLAKLYTKLLSLVASMTISYTICPTVVLRAGQKTVMILLPKV